MSHTPGPWFAEPSFAPDWDFVVMSRAVRVAHALRLTTNDDPEQIAVTEANARLIAAGPDMLAALKEAREQFYDERHSWMNEAEFTASVAFIDAAIAKADGHVDRHPSLHSQRAR